MKPISIITRINLAMAAIIFMAISTILVSYWLSDQSDNDAYAINMSGSMRMHSYRMALDNSVEQSHKSDVENIFKDPIVYSVAYNAGLIDDLKKLEQKWLLIEPNQLEQLDLFVDDLNSFVGRIQENAEANIRTLRAFQVFAFFITMILSSIVIYWIHLRFTIPLKELTQNARQISRGDFTFNVIPAEGDDELSVLSRSLEHMCKAIAYMYESLEKQVEDKTGITVTDLTSATVTIDAAGGYTVNIENAKGTFKVPFTLLNALSNPFSTVLRSIVNFKSPFTGPVCSNSTVIFTCLRYFIFNIMKLFAKSLINTLS